jgi:hypothetical protein
MRDHEVIERGPRDLLNCAISGNAEGWLRSKALSQMGVFVLQHVQPRIEHKFLRLTITAVFCFTTGEGVGIVPECSSPLIHHAFMIHDSAN